MPKVMKLHIMKHEQYLFTINTIVIVVLDTTHQNQYMLIRK